MFDGRCFVRLDSCMFSACMRTTLALRLVPIVWSVFYQAYFNHLVATHFNISIFGHQIMFHDVWSPNISRLGRPLVWSSQLSSPAVHVTDKRQTSYILEQVARSEIAHFGTCSLHLYVLVWCPLEGKNAVTKNLALFIENTIPKAFKLTKESQTVLLS